MAEKQKIKGNVTKNFKNFNMEKQECSEFEIAVKMQKWYAEINRNNAIKWDIEKLIQYYRDSGECTLFR